MRDQYREGGACARRHGVAMRGESTDGNRYIDAAIAGGAVAVVSDSATQPAQPGIPWLQVRHGRRALATLSANFFGHPARKLKITGITGTNGKTTTAFLLSQILKFAGRGEPVLIGTIEYHVAGEIIPAPHTTPEPLELQRIFAQATHSRLGKLAGSEAVMEVSSHALAQERIFGLHYDVAVFTNLSRDHLDYHRNMDDYFAAKQALFQGCGAPPPRVSVINHDDEAGRKLVAISRAAGSQVSTYGLSAGDFRAEVVRLSSEGTSFQLRTLEGSMPVNSQLVGRVNVYNLLAAMAAACARGISLPAIVNAAGRCQSR